MTRVKAVLAWVLSTAKYGAKSAKTHIAIAVAVLLWASTNLQDPLAHYAQVALLILGFFGVTAGPRQYGTKDAPVDQGGPPLDGP